MKKKSVKKLLALAMTLSLAASLAGCGSGGDTGETGTGTEGSATEEPAAEAPEEAPAEEAESEGAPEGAVTITLGYDEGVGEATREAIKDFNASQSEIYVQGYNLPQDADNLHDDFVNKMVAQDTSVDVMALDVVNVSEFAAAGWLSPMDDLFEEGELDNYLSGAVEGAKYNGTLYAAPWFTNASALFYRTDILEKLNVTEVPTTYDGWKEVYDKLDGSEGIDYAFCFQGIKGEAMVCNWVEFLWSFGGDVLNADGTPNCNSAENIEATKMMADLIGTYAPEGVTTYAETESQQVFQEGKALTCRTWSGTWNIFNDEAQSSVAGNVGMTVLPVYKEGDTAHSCLGGLDLAINTYIDDEHKAAAETFVKYMVSEEVEKTFTLRSAQPPTYKSVYSDAEVLEKIPFYADFFTIIENGKGRPVSPNYAELSDAIQRNVHEALTGEKDVETALGNLQTEAEGLSK